MFPNHLFRDAAAELRRFDAVFVVEEPLYFGHDVNKVRLAHMRASMRFYAAFLRARGVGRVEYVDYVEAPGLLARRLPADSFGRVCCFDPGDAEAEAKYRAALGDRLHVLEDSPMFLATPARLAEYHRTRSGFFGRVGLRGFFEFMKKELGVLEGVRSLDAENRRPLPRTHVPLPLERYASERLNEAIGYVDAHPTFRGNVGDTANASLFPSTFEEAERALEAFLERRLRHFGDYQDAIRADEVLAYHSGISAALNNGLLTPAHALARTLAFYEANNKGIGKGIGLNNLEGFVRQLVGWREYMRYLYNFHRDELLAGNHWEASRGLVWDKWRNGTTGLRVLDAEIRKCAAHAYSHHIVRLMVFLNLFVLCGVRPDDIVRWFSEVCAIDAYPWVMQANVRAMGWFSPRFMRKPYISTAAYVKRMGDYDDGPHAAESDATWTALFYAFLERNRHKLQGTSRIYLRNLAHFERMPEAERRAIRARASAFIRSVTTPTAE